MWATLLKLLGPALVGWLSQWFGQRQHDKLVVKAESAARAGEALKASQQATKDRHEIEDDIARAPADDNRGRLSKWASKDD